MAVPGIRDPSDPLPKFRRPFGTDPPTPTPCTTPTPHPSTKAPFRAAQTRLRQGLGWRSSWAVGVAGDPQVSHAQQTGGVTRIVGGVQGQGSGPPPCHRPPRVLLRVSGAKWSSPDILPAPHPQPVPKEGHPGSECSGVFPRACFVADMELPRGWLWHQGFDDVTKSLNSPAAPCYTSLAHNNLFAVGGGGASGR